MAPKMDKLDEILTSYVAEADGGKQKPGKDQLLGAAFVVVNKDGEFRRRRHDDNNNNNNKLTCIFYLCFVFVWPMTLVSLQQPRETLT